MPLSTSPQLFSMTSWVLLITSFAHACSSNSIGHQNLPAFAINFGSIQRPGVKPIQSILFSTTEPVETKEVSNSSPEDVDEVPDINAIVGENNIVEDNKDWISATRTLGSLFLHQDDAHRAVSNDSKNNGESSSEEADGDISSSLGNSLTSFLLKMKQQEEVNREKYKKSRDVNDGGTSKDKSTKQDLSTVFQIDQVCSVIPQSLNCFLCF